MYNNAIVKQVVAVNNLGYIGKDNTLMWHNKEDLKHFKETTMWNVLVCGRKTYESMPSAVHQGRVLIQVSRSGDKGTYTLENALAKAETMANKETIFVIGGGEIYDATMQYVDEILLSRIDNDLVGDTSYKVSNAFELAETIDYETFTLERYVRKTAVLNKPSLFDMAFNTAPEEEACGVPLGVQKDAFTLTVDKAEDGEIIESIDVDTNWSFKDSYDYNNAMEGCVIKTNKQTIKFGISSGQSCCETYGYFTSEDDIQSFVGAKILDITTTDLALKTTEIYKETIGLSDDGKTHDVYDGGVLFINVLTDRGTFQLVTYNIHNGYYGHNAVLISTQLNIDTGL